MATDGLEQRTADAAERADREWRENVFIGDDLRETLIDVIRSLVPAEPRYPTWCACSEGSLIRTRLLAFDRVRELHQLDLNDWRILSFSAEGRCSYMQRFHTYERAIEEWREVGP